MALEESSSQTKPSDEHRQTSLSVTNPTFSAVLGKETAAERPLFAIVGSTIVADPDFIHLVGQAEGDGLGTKKFDMERVLEDIAQGRATLDDLKALAEKNATDQKHSVGPLEDLKSAAEVVGFMGRVIYLESTARGIVFPGIWQKIVLLNGQPYAICALNKPQNDLLQTLSGVRKGQTNIPKYWGDVLDGYNANCDYETEEHMNMGPLSYRLAAIVDTARTRAFEDIRMKPREIDVGIQSDKNFPDGRLYIIVKKR